MDILVDRRLVVALALAGGILSVLASMLRIRGVVGERGRRVLDYAGYGCMGTSMVLFLVAGLRGTAA